MSNVKCIHFVGISGIGTSALASILYAQGNKITGSDCELSLMALKLKRVGVTIFNGHSKNNIDKSIDLVVHSLAIPNTNPELREAKRLKIPILTYPEAVGQFSKQYFTIAVCGTHGKSTITGLIAKVLIEHQFDPTVIIGTTLKELGNANFRVGKSKLLVLEACEYKRAFLNYHPNVILLNTLEPDHLDYYHDFDDYFHAFREFVVRLPKDGYFFGNLDTDNLHLILKTLQENKFSPYNTFTYSSRYETSDFYLKDRTIMHRNAKFGELNLKIPGRHNRVNALGAFAVCSVLGIKPKDIIHSLNSYVGAWRRFEIKGKIGKTTIIDDYGHHPTEILATLQAAREKFPKEKICVVFQPHQYNRTKNLLDAFARSFDMADTVIIPNIYEVRDTPADKHSISPEKLMMEIKKHHSHVHYGDGLTKTISYLKKHIKEFDVILTMGAGDVWKVAEGVLKNKLKIRNPNDNSSSKSKAQNSQLF